MLKKHHRKATHQGVLQGIAELLDRAGISHRAKRRSEEVNNCFEGKTLEGTHLYRVAKRKNSRAPTPCLRAFRRNRGLLGNTGGQCEASAVAITPTTRRQHWTTASRALHGGAGVGRAPGYL